MPHFFFLILFLFFTSSANSAYYSLLFLGDVSVSLRPRFPSLLYLLSFFAPSSIPYIFCPVTPFHGTKRGLLQHSRSASLCSSFSPRKTWRCKIRCQRQARLLHFLVSGHAPRSSSRITNAPSLRTNEPARISITVEGREPLPTACCRPPDMPGSG